MREYVLGLLAYLTKPIWLPYFKMRIYFLKKKRDRQNKLNEALRLAFECKLIHTQVPFMTDESIWCDATKEYRRKIEWRCSEGCKPLK